MITATAIGHGTGTGKFWTGRIGQDANVDVSLITKAMRMNMTLYVPPATISCATKTMDAYEATTYIRGALIKHGFLPNPSGE